MTALAREEDRPVEASADQEAGQYLTFILQGELYAIDILNIKEIIEYGSLTVVPMMPEVIRGVINLRGAVVPVIDLASRFGGESSTITRKSCIVILELHSGEVTEVVGVVVDAVDAVLEIAAADIAPAPAFGAKIRTESIHGMAKVQKGFAIILDVDNVLSAEDLSLLGQVEQAASLHEAGGAGSAPPGAAS